MFVSPVPPIAVQPQVTLTHWCIVQSFTGEFHFVGYCMALGSPRFSTQVQLFDPVTRTGITRSGRVYHMLGAHGLDAGGLEFLDIIETYKGLDYVDVTERLLDSGTRADSADSEQAQMVDALFTFLDMDMTATFEQPRPVAQELLDRIEALLGDMGVDLDTPPNPDKE